MRTALILCLPLLFGCATTDVVESHGTPQEKQQIQDARDVGDDETADAIEENILVRVINGSVALMTPFVPPPLMPFVPFLPALLLPRVRRLTGKSAKATGSAIKNLVTGKPGASGAKVGEALEGLVELVGIKDSRPDPEDES